MALGLRFGVLGMGLATMVAGLSAPAIALTSIGEQQAVVFGAEMPVADAAGLSEAEFSDDGLSTGEKILMLLGSVVFSVMLLGRKPD